LQKLFFDKPESVTNAIRQGKKLVVYAVGDDKSTISAISEIIVKKLPNPTKNYDIIEPAVKYINDHYNRDIKLDGLATLCDVSKSYLCRLFHARYGTGVTEYAIGVKMEHACKLLVETDNTVVSVAFEVGYSDCGYFNRLFKKKFGVTPLEYRENPAFCYVDAL
jgi:AraC-like DNA-binding protein